MMASTRHPGRDGMNELTKLPKKLYEDVIAHMHGPALTAVPLLRGLEPTFIVELALRVSAHLLLPDEAIFTEGDARQPRDVLCAPRHRVRRGHLGPRVAQRARRRRGVGVACRRQDRREGRVGSAGGELFRRARAHNGAWADRGGWLVGAIRSTKRGLVVLARVSDFLSAVRPTHAASQDIRRSSTVRALTVCDINILTRASLVEVLAEFPEVRVT